MANHKNAVSYTQNRELSWLKFNERVLLESMDSTVPLMERLKFVSIFASNLDEFYMIRVGTLQDLVELKDNSLDSKTGMSPQEQLNKIYQETHRLYEKKDQSYDEIRNQLRFHDIWDLSYEELSPEESKMVRQYFKSSVLPILSPQIMDAHHPFPHLQNKALHIVTNLTIKGKEVLGILPIPHALPPVFFLPGVETRYIRMENIVSQFAALVFDGYTVTEQTVIRVTRNEDINFDDENYYGTVSKEDGTEVDFRKKVQKIAVTTETAFPCAIGNIPRNEPWIAEILMQ